MTSPLPERPELWHGLSAGEVHIWRVSLDQDDAARVRVVEQLSPDERERVEQFRFEPPRNQFIVSRGSLRQVLAQYLDTSPSDLRFALGPHGKPVLAADAGGTVAAATPSVPRQPLHFNVAHSGCWWLAAVTALGELGVDIERIRTPIDHERLVRRFFSAGEAAALGELPSEQRLQAFFQAWARKEACLKATGAGLSVPLHRLDVLGFPYAPDTFRSISVGDQTPSLELCDLAVDPAYASALALARRPNRIVHFRPLLPVAS